MTTRSEIGSTELADASRCDRLYALKHLYHLVAIDSPRGRTIGTLLHVWLRYWYAQFLPGVLPAWFYRRTAEEEIAIVGNGVNPDYLETAKAMFLAYLHQFAAVDQSLTILSVEQQYRITVRTIVAAMGTLTDSTKRALEWLSLDDYVTIRPDLMIAAQTGIQYMPDYKSQLGMGRGLPQWSRHNRYGLSWQAYMYLWVGRHLIDDAGRLLFPRIKSFVVQRIQNTVPFHADRNELEITAAVYDEIPHLILRQMAFRKALRKRIESGEKIDGSYWSCWNEHGRCDFFTLCREEPHRRIEMMNDPLIFRFENDDDLALAA